MDEQASLPKHSITTLIVGLQGGEEKAVGPLFNRYFSDLVGFAWHRLGKRLPAEYEDVAASAFADVVLRLREGRLQQVTNREDFWRFLIRSTLCKGIDRLRIEHRLKRGAGRVYNETSLAGDPEFGHPLDQLLDPLPPPEYMAMLADERRHLLGLLDDDLREVALARLNGETNAAIARQRDCNERTVERQLRLIRAKWSRELDG